METSANKHQDIKKSKTLYKVQNLLCIILQDTLYSIWTLTLRMLTLHTCFLFIRYFPGFLVPC